MLPPGPQGTMISTHQSGTQILLVAESCFYRRTFEESQPDLRARLRLEVKDSNQGSQSTRGVIGLEISGLFARPPSAAIAYPNAEIINATTERERKA